MDVMLIIYSLCQFQAPCKGQNQSSPFPLAKLCRQCMQIAASQAESTVDWKIFEYIYT